MNWIIAAIIAPVPLFHLWLHGLLFYWRKYPLLFYLCGGAVWGGSFFFFFQIEQVAEVVFIPADLLRLCGYALMIVGLAGILSSMYTLGIKRFFVWAVLRPHSVPAIRIHTGPFSAVPHPAYFGYLFVSLGNFLASGKLYLFLLFIFLFTVTPLVIRLEEEELEKRTSLKKD